MQTTIPVYNLISSVVKVLHEVYDGGNSSPPQGMGFSCQEIHKLVMPEAGRSRSPHQILSFSRLSRHPPG